MQEFSGDVMDRNGIKPKSASTVAVVPDYRSSKLVDTPRQWLVILLIIGAPILLCIILVIIFMLTSTFPTPVPYTSVCLPSAESNRSDLTSFLQELKYRYFHTLHPQSISAMPGVTDEDIRMTFRPYDPSPNATKNRTDEAAKLLNELNSLNISITQLKLRERKAIHVARAVLKNNFGWAPYTQNYYIGDWLLGPDMYCWQPICNVFSDLNSALTHLKPRNLEELESLRELFQEYNRTFKQYVGNLKLGPLSGYVRPLAGCKAGLHNLKYVYYKSVADGNETGIYEEEFSKILLKSGFFEDISEENNRTWEKRFSKNVTDYFNQSLFENIALPAIKMLSYVETEHLDNCPDDENFITSGMGWMPLNFLYHGRIPDTSKSATGELPTGGKLKGSKTFETLMTYFTTIDITPEELRRRAVGRLNELYKEAVDLAVKYTGSTNNLTAVNTFQTKLRDPLDSAFNIQSFPANESDDNAFMKCTDVHSAQAYCPKRWSAMKVWMNHSTETMKIIKPYLPDLFYERGKDKTIPDCPIEVVPFFHPYAVFHSYNVGSKDCKFNATQGLPFFLEKYGPTWTEYTTTAHEQSPGHHLEVQSFLEYFEDDCSDPIHWLSAYNYFPAYTEGWATYVEYQLLPRDTTIYNIVDKKIILQKYGMIYYQLLAALRAIVDIDLNYYRKRREDALQMYSDFVWEDRNDFAQNDITRIQSAPGSVTSYMIGQMEISRIRARAESVLGSQFSLREFHYQVLRQGEVPLAYLEEHIEAYIECKKDPSLAGCGEIL